MSIVLYFFVQKIPLEAVAIGDSLDWKDLNASEISERVLKKVKPGSIVLFHNAAKHTPEALPEIIESLQKDGYKIVPISQLIIKDNYKIDSTGMQIPLPQGDSKVQPSEIKKATPKGVATGRYNLFFDTNYLFLTPTIDKEPTKKGCQNDSLFNYRIS